MKHNSDRSLQFTESNLQAIFAAMNDLVLIRDGEGRCLQILTPHIPWIWYCPPEQALGRTLHETLPQPVADLLLSGIQTALQTRQLVNREYSLDIKGQAIWMEAHLTPLTDTSVLIVVRNISDRKQLELQLIETQSSLQGILNDASAAIVSFRLYPDYRIEYQYYSVGCEVTYGYSQAALLADSTLWQSRIYPEDWQEVLLPAFPTLVAQSTMDIEYRFYRADGSLRWITETATARWDDLHQCWNVITVARDETDRKLLEAEREQTLQTLQAQEERLRLCLELNKVGCWDWYIDANQLVWDEQCFHLFGLVSCKAITFEVWKNQVHPEDAPRLEQALAESFTKREDYYVEYRILLPDGTIRWLAEMARCLYEAQAPTRMIGLTMDVSDRKTTELLLQDLNAELNRRVEEKTQALQVSQAELQQREHELRSLLENTPDLIARFDRDLDYVYVNAAITKATGLPPEDFIGKPFAGVQAPQGLRGLLRDRLQSILTTAQTTSIYLPYPTPHGICHFETKFVPEFNEDGQVESILAISRDITTLKESEAALRQSEERFRRLFEASPIAIGIARADDYQFMKVNPAYCSVVGYSEAELYTMGFSDITHPDDLDKDLAQVEQLAIGAVSSFQIEKRFIHKNGTIIWTRLTVTLLRDFDQGIDYSLGLIEDITERRKAEEALRQSEAKFRTFFDFAPLPMSLANIHTRRIERVNTAFQAWLGYSYEEIYAQTFLDFTHPEDVDEDFQLSELMQTGNLVHIHTQKRFIKQSGQVAWAEMSAVLIRDSDDRPLYSLCLTQDITQAKELASARDQAEQALRLHSQRERVLRDITQHIHQSLNLDEILTIAVVEVLNVLNADRVLIFRLYPNGSGIVVKESVREGFATTNEDEWKDVVLSSESQAFYHQCIPRVILDLAQDEFTLRPVDYLQTMGTQTKITAPILQIDERGTTLWGLLLVHACATKREWQPDEADLLQQIANQLAIAIQQATLYQQVQTDLVQRLATESQLRSLLQEKEVLLKEVHHRVKNNLQIITSLLRMQSRQVDSNISPVFREAQNRVQSIAIIHEHLYQSADLSHINFREYVHVLINQLFRAYGVNSRQIKTSIEIESLNLSLNQAIACGLIINEVVSNSLKYAFSNHESGEVKIFLRTNEVSFSEMKQGILIIEDNGTGMPADLDWQTTRSLGLRIVRMLVDQIKGTITLDRTLGTSFHITFDLDPS